MEKQSSIPTNDSKWCSSFYLFFLKYCIDSVSSFSVSLNKNTNIWRTYPTPLFSGLIPSTMSLLPPVKENLSCGTVYKPTFQGQNRLEKELESIHQETDTWIHRQKALPLLLLSGGNALFPVLKDTVQQWDRYNHGVLSWAEFNHNHHYWLQFSFNFYLKITELILPQPFKFVMSKGTHTRVSLWVQARAKQSGSIHPEPERVKNESSLASCFQIHPQNPQTKQSKWIIPNGSLDN